MNDIDKQTKLCLSIQIVQSDLTSCGITLNEAKCICKSSSCMEWLGLITSLNNMTFRLQVEKRLLIHKYLTKLHKTGYTGYYWVVGYLVTFTLSVVPRALLSTRYLQMAISEAPQWEFRINFTITFLGEFLYWSKKLGYEVSRPIFERETLPSACSLYTDASASGGRVLIQNSLHQNKYREEVNNREIR